MKKYLTLLSVVFFLGVQIAVSQNAPISTVGNVATTGTTIDVPITVADFVNIGSCNMQLLFDPAIASATSVVKGSSLPGGINYNNAVPGIIRFGWYTWPGVNLPDDEVAFIITFTKVTAGTSAITWDASYADRQWSDGNFIVLNDLPLTDYYFPGSVSFQENAPITTAPIIDACPNTPLDIPITVKDFNGIGAISLRLHYNPSALTFLSFTNNSGFPGLFVFNPIPGVITAAGFSTSAGVTLPEDAVLFTIHVQFLGGYTNLEWYDDDGTSCEYTGPPTLYPVLNDTPTSTYYIVGSITELCTSEWTGNIDDDWFDAGNWTNGVPNAAKDGVIPVVAPNPYPRITGDAFCKEADIATGASITVLTTGTLTATGDFNNDGSLIIESSATGDGSFIDNGTITGVGDETVQRYIESEMWHYVSSPISDGLSDIYYDIYLKEFHEVDSTWFYLIPVDIPLNPMQGYGTFATDNYTGTTTVSYVGSLNTGSLSVSLTNSGGALHNSKGFNFVGNPYCSAIDWDYASGWTKTNLDNAIYFWNPDIGQYGGYVNYPPTGTNGATNIIPSGQGFFVHVTDGNPTGSLEVNNAARLHDNKPFMKNSNADFEQPVIRLSTFSEMNDYSDEVVLQFLEDGTTDYDPEFDAYKFSGLDEAPGLYYRSADNVLLSINTYPELDDNMVIPLYATVGVTGYYTIEASEMLNFEPTTEIFLEDKLENIIVNLTEQNSYIYFADVSNDPDRFNLRIMLTPDNTIEISDNSGVQIYGSNATIYLKQGSNNPLDGEVRIFDLLGKLILAETIEGMQTHEMHLNYEGILLVSYFDETNQKEYRQKVHLK